MSTHKVREHARTVDGETVTVRAHQRRHEGAQAGPGHSHKVTDAKRARRTWVIGDDVKGAAATLGVTATMVTIYLLQMVLSVTLAILVTACTVLMVLVGWQLRRQHQRIKATRIYKSASKVRKGYRKAGVNYRKMRSDYQKTRGSADQGHDTDKRSRKSSRTGRRRANIRIGKFRFTWGR